MSNDFFHFMQSKAGCELLRDVHRIAEALEKSVPPPVTPLPTPETLPAHLAEICADRTKLHHLREDTKDWAFTNVRPFYSRSFSFRQEKNGFYHFVATLLGHDENQLFAVNIVGDCGCDTYKAGESMTLRQFASWFGHSYPDYLLSKGTHKAEFQARRAREQMVAFFKENRPSAAEANEEAQRAWEEYGGHIDNALYSACANVTDLYNIVSEAADEIIEADDDLKESFKDYMTTDFFDHEWGMDYDAMDYARIEQLRWFGLWLLEHFKEK